jgi:polyphosphate kinase
LRPGLPGISETIQVRSIVDRFLEHSRLMIFGEGHKQQVYLSSADWMPRNFERRVEAMFPIEAPDLRERIRSEILPAYLHDNSKARVLMPDGSYVRATAWHDEPEYRAQRDLLSRSIPPAPAKTSIAGVANNGQPVIEATDSAKHAGAKAR